jgi:hypothetical protein
MLMARLVKPCFFASFGRSGLRAEEEQKRNGRGRGGFFRAGDDKFIRGK